MTFFPRAPRFAPVIMAFSMLGGCGSASEGGSGDPTIATIEPPRAAGDRDDEAPANDDGMTTDTIVDAGGAIDVGTNTDVDAGAQGDAGADGGATSGGATGGGAATDGGATSGGAGDDVDDADVAWAALRALAGMHLTLPGWCSTVTMKRRASVPGTCYYEDVPTLGGTGICNAKLTFGIDAATDALIATVEEIKGPPSNFCWSEVLTVLPPVTTTITIPLERQPDGSARGVGQRPSTDTKYILEIQPKVRIKLTAAGYAPSLADRQAATTAGICLTPTRDSRCTFEVTPQ